VCMCISIWWRSWHEAKRFDGPTSLESSSWFFSASWVLWATAGQSRLNSLSFALPILSLCSSYANRLFTFVKTKRRERRENREEQGEREGDKRGLRAARKQSSSFFFIAGCPQFLLLFLLLHFFFLLVGFPSLYFCETFAILCNFGEITDFIMTINQSFKSFYAIFFYSRGGSGSMEFQLHYFLINSRQMNRRLYKRWSNEKRREIRGKEATQRFIPFEEVNLFL